MARESVLYTPDHTSLQEGYRLHTLEVYNWGTFHQEVWKITPGGHISLLTGANGSGKSTLVDALITLIVPPGRRGYNLASGSESRKKGERNLDSYFHGEYGRTRNDEQDSVLRLRERKTYSALVAVFYNQKVNKTVALAQVLYMGDGGKAIPLYIVAEQELSIQRDLSFDGETRSFKKRLASQGSRVYDEFSKYSADFKRLFGLRSDNALELFNKIVSMKEIGRLNDFVRDYMLEPLNVRDRIDNLYKNYQNLDELYRVIQRDQHALQHLVPLSELSMKRDHTRRDLEVARRCTTVVPAYMAYRKGLLLQTEIETLQIHLQTLRGELDAAKAQRDTKRAERDGLRLSIDSDNVGSQITRLKKEIDTRKTIMRPKNRRANDYNKVAMLVGLPGYTDLQSFQYNQAEAQRRRDALADQRAALDDRRREQEREEERAQNACEELETELTELRRSKNNLSPDLIRVRRQIAGELGIDESAIPFIGELLQVPQQHASWEGAIEKLLHGYAQQLLVTPALYGPVRRYVEQAKLNTRVIYNVVNEHRQNVDRPQDRTLVLFKLEMNKDAERHFTTWLRNELALRWNYACVPDVQAFDGRERAITINGQIKHSSARHEKDDRRFGDRSSYVLGWDNRAKITTLEGKLATEQDALRAVRQHIQKTRREEQQLNEQQRELDVLAGFAEFEEIDWHPDQAQIDNWTIELRDLEQSSNIQQLTQQLQAIEKDLLALDTTIERYQAGIGGTQSKLETSETEYVRSQKVVNEAPADASDYEERIRSHLDRQYPQGMSLVSIDSVTRDTQNYFDNSASSYQGQVTAVEREITRGITTFHKDQEFAELIRLLDDDLDALPDYLLLKVRLDEDDLPRHKERFRAMMNEDIARDIVAFREELDRKVEEYRERIETLNTALRQIPYSATTHIQLEYEKPSSTGEINKFRADLNAAIPNQMRPELMEGYFEPIRQLIERLRTETEWQKRVTDPRQWLDYYAREYDAEGRGGEVYNDSSGKSGGQKAKLAYTVLASAIADQYGINQDREDADRAFRFVVVDEVFSKLDEGNARFAMQLFEQLHLQVLVVTPMDKMHIVEPFIGAIHIVSNPKGNESTVLDLSIEEYQSSRSNETDQP